MLEKSLSGFVSVISRIVIDRFTLTVLMQFETEMNMPDFGVKRWKFIKHQSLGLGGITLTCFSPIWFVRPSVYACISFTCVLWSSRSSSWWLMLNLTMVIVSCVNQFCSQLLCCILIGIYCVWTETEASWQSYWHLCCLELLACLMVHSFDLTQVLCSLLSFYHLLLL